MAWNGTEYEVVITKARIGFPRGVWNRLMYRPMAEKVCAELRTHGVGCKVRERKKRGAPGLV
jgi:hypothetical protein